MISVVIPTLNEAERLPALLAQLRAESMPPEIVVSDGGSTDRTAAIAAVGGTRCISGPPGRGAQLARGIAASRGSVVLMLHADSRSARRPGRDRGRARESACRAGRQFPPAVRWQ